jgi:hypothetical protein
MVVILLIAPARSTIGTGIGQEVADLIVTAIKIGMAIGGLDAQEDNKKWPGE